MTVGEPEINLNTWGIRYVRKKDSPFNTSAITGDRSSDFKHSDYSSGGKGAPVKDSKTETLAQPRPDEEQVSSYSPSREQESISGKKQTTGGTQETSRANPFGQERSLTSGGKLSTSGAPKHGKEAPQTKQPQHPLADNKRDESGNPWKKVRNEGGSTKPSKLTDATGSKERRGGKVKPEHAPSGKLESLSLPEKNPERKGGEVKPKHAPSAKPTSITRAALDLAIIKCKLLKANHGFGSKRRHGSENTGSANISEAGNKKETKTPVESKTETLASERPDETEVTSYGEGATGTHGNDSKALKPTGEMRDVKTEGRGEGHGDKAPNTIINRSEDEIVIKAIELINEAYTEMNKKFSHGEAEAVKPSHRKDGEKDESDKND